MNPDFLFSITTVVLVVIGLLAAKVKELYTQLKGVKRVEDAKDFAEKLKQDSAESSHWYQQFVKWSAEVKTELDHCKKEHEQCRSDYAAISKRVSELELKLAKG